MERTTGFEPATLTLAKKKIMEFVRVDGCDAVDAGIVSDCLRSNRTSANESKTAPGNSRNSAALMTERLVRFRQTFFDDLDSLLPDERGRDGRPSATDFLLSFADDD